MSYQVEFVVLHVGKSKMTVYLTNAEGKTRKVEYAWLSQVGTDVPPAGWLDSVLGELALHDKGVA